MPSKSVKIGSPAVTVLKRLHDAIFCCKLLKKFFYSLLSVLMRNSSNGSKIVSITNVRGLAHCANFVEFSPSILSLR